MIWKKTNLGELVDLTQGFAINKKSKHYVVEEGLPLLRITDMINENEAVFIREDIPEKFIASPEDIIYTRTGQVGLVFRNQMGVIHNNCFTVEPINGELSREYLYWFLRNPEIKKRANTLAAGAAQPDLNHGSFKSLEISYPINKAIQLRIANILDAFDNYIENNKKRIKLLEEAAQHLYKEWFVNFRFPGSENSSINEETGLPEGWSETTVSSLCEVKSGFAFKSKQWQEKGNPVIKIKNIDNNTIDFNNAGYITDEDASKASKYKLFPGDVLIAMTGATVGKIGSVPVTNRNIYLNQRVGLFRPILNSEDNIPYIFTFFLSENAQKQVVNFASGAAQPNISTSEIGNIKIPKPHKPLLTEFNVIVKGFLKQTNLLHSYNERLKEARDLLLPRLMNRTIEV